VLLVSTMAEHGRNLAHDQRASLALNDPSAPGDPLDRPRITLAGRVVQPEGKRAGEALDAHVAAIPGAMLYAGWEDFTLWVLEVERVRWVGGFARMETVSREDYRAAEPDPTAPVAAKSVAHLNKDHADALLAIARELGGARGAVAAVCTGIDRYGIDLGCTGAGQSAAARVPFEEPLQKAADVRPATVALAQRAKALQAHVAD
jgi:putative heme iron utilization protein